MRASRPLPLALSLPLLLNLVPSSAHAEAPDEPGAAVLLAPDPRFPSADARHDFLWQHDLAYRDALGSRRLWTAVAVVGGGGGLLLSGVAALSRFTYDYGCGMSHLGDAMGDIVVGALGGEPDDDSVICKPEPGWIEPAIYTGLVVAAVSVAVGGPLAFSAHGRVKRIRSAYPVISFDADPRLARLTLRWQF